ncbi:hypothetical protein [Streptomyces canus]|uniref:DUF1795 domain-containing protein n=1 Tax=Streptomyces canus TaxID=58343 RepID=A0AAW8FBS3_9ACTN|nr:hypothetical protein [Streptomyces canus]MDQ0764299.1 hypothetical protein [Streptomyces canus]MDQ0907242.1 hypothetical protein [Streptomyces canus]
MATTLPVAIEFELPHGWRAAPPDEVGAPDTAFIALHPQPDAGFTANITIDGEYLPDSATLREIADGSVARVRKAGAVVEITDRREMGSKEVPGLIQKLAIAATVSGVPRDLVQTQAYLCLLDVADPHKRAVIRLVLTSTAAQHQAVVGDFEDFVRTVRPGTRAVS